MPQNLGTIGGNHMGIKGCVFNVETSKECIFNCCGRLDMIFGHRQGNEPNMQWDLTNLRKIKFHLLSMYW